MITGIYAILNKSTGDAYIGSAIDIRFRWYKHRRQLKENRHPNSYLQNAWNKYGALSFEFVLLEQTETINLLRKEQHYITLFGTYNIRKVAYSNFGLKASPTTRRLISEAGKRRWAKWRLKHPMQPKPIKVHIPWNKGKKLPKWLRKKFSLAKLRNPVRYWQGKTRSNTTKQTISKKLKGRKLSKVHAMNIGIGHRGLKYQRRGTC